jgi:acetyl esterase/lipase
MALRYLRRYRIHCLGHSLGGGVAALAAYLLRTSPELREQLQGASGVMATGNTALSSPRFGCQSCGSATFTAQASITLQQL